MRMKRWIGATVAGLGLVAAAAALATTASSAATVRTAADAHVTVVHGIPGVAVDVYVDGKVVLSDFTFKTVTSPLALPPGKYRLAVRVHGASPTSKPVLAATEKLNAGENATIVANLTTSGMPTLTVFANPTGAIKKGDTRIIVRHVADAPAVDVYAGSTKVINGLTNPHQATLVIPAAQGVPIKVDVHDTTTTVIGPVTLNFPAGMTTIVYAIGSVTGNTLTAVVQTY